MPPYGTKTVSTERLPPVFVPDGVSSSFNQKGSMMDTYNKQYDSYTHEERNIEVQRKLPNDHPKRSRSKSANHLKMPVREQCYTLTRLEQEGIGELKDKNIRLQTKIEELSEMLEKQYRWIQSVKLKATNQRQLEAANTKLEQQLLDAQENIHHMAIQYNALADEKQELETTNKKFEQRLRKANEKCKASEEECLQWQFDKQNKEKK